MKKYLIIIFTIGFITLGSVCFYLKTQIDTARNDILNLTSTVNLQEKHIAETESELNITESRLKETESELNITESGLKETESELDLEKSRLEETRAELIVTYNERDEALELNEELETTLSNTEYNLARVEENLQSQKTKTSELQAEVEAIQEELQLYHDTGITVAQGIVPPYRTSLSGSFDLENNPSAINTSWPQLKGFLRKDRTDKNLYIENVYMCGEFAETLHNNAENSGIKVAWVAIQFEDESTPHALNAFVTTDRGLVYIDTTGTELGSDRPRHMDRVVTIDVGKRLYPKLLFASDWRISPGSSKVSQVEIYW